MKTYRQLAVVIALATCLAAPAAAQLAQTTDELYTEARALAFDGKREQARELCGTILDRNPSYIDARILLGRLYAWDKEYARAREELSIALNQRPDYVDARLALIDVEVWSGNPQLALQYADNGLVTDPDNAELLYRKMSALRRLGRDEEALGVAQALLALEPERDDARRQYYGMLDAVLLNKLSADYRYVTFDDSTADWHLFSFAYRRFTPVGSVIGRLNVARRFDKTGAQLEVDAYPSLARFWDNTYAYLNFGVSGSSLFPRVRVGAEVFHNFPQGWEGSLGFRFLDFENSNTTILTGSIAKYLGDYWIALRPNYVPDSTGNSLSGLLTVRRFFGSRYEYAEISVGGGIEDEVVNFANVTEQLDSFRISGELRRRIKDDIILKGVIGFRTEDFPGNRKRDSLILGIGVERYF